MKFWNLHSARAHPRRIIALLLVLLIAATLTRIPDLHAQIDRLLFEASALIQQHRILGAVVFVLASAVSAMLVFFSAAASSTAALAKPTGSADLRACSMRAPSKASESKGNCNAVAKSMLAADTVSFAFVSSFFSWSAAHAMFASRSVITAINMLVFITTSP